MALGTSISTTASRSTTTSTTISIARLGSGAFGDDGDGLTFLPYVGIFYIIFFFQQDL